MFGPDTRAPRTFTASAGVTQSLGSGVSVHLQATRRRTDFLLRRRNLNLSLNPVAQDADGREIFRLGFFSDVRVYEEQVDGGVVLVFDVEENPVVRQISLAGNEEVDSDDIREALTLTTAHGDLEA